MNAKEFYYFGILEQVGFKKDVRITMGEFKSKVQNEKLFLVANIDFNPSNIYQADSVFLIEENNVFKVLTTGERGSGITLEFSEIGFALNYMLAYLRLKKKQINSTLKNTENYIKR